MKTPLSGNFKNFNSNKIIYFYWIPRIITSLLLIFAYKYLHLEDGGDVDVYSRFINADIDKYTNTYKYNFLYSFFNTYFLTGRYKLILGFIFGQLISSYSVISIYKSSEKLLKNIKIPNISLFILAIHPMLILYSLKFSTDNFVILGFSFFLRSRVLDNINFSNEKDYLRGKFLNLLYIIICLFFKAQLLPLVIVDILLLLNKNLKYNHSYFKSKNRYIFLPFTILLIAFIINFSIFVIYPYIDTVFNNLWDNKFPLKAADIYNYICNEFGCSENYFINFLIKLVAWIFYLIPATIFLTGARSRFADLPWEISIGNLTISSFKRLNDNGNEQILNNFNQSYFIIVVIIPLILFSLFHLKGLFSYLKNINQSRFDICLGTFSLIALPLLFYPCLRYYIPCIALSCIGASLSLPKINKILNKGFVNLIAPFN